MIAIREMLPSDIDTIVELEKKLLGETLGVEMLTNELTNPYAYFLVISFDGQAIGYIGAWIIDGTCEIINFLIASSFQRHGYGTQLFNALVDTAKSLKAVEVILDVKVTNDAARCFYEKRGFIKINERLNYYADGTKAYVMRKELI